MTKKYIDKEGRPVDKDGKPVPRVEKFKYKDAEGQEREGSREYYRIGVRDIDVSHLEEQILKISLHRLKDHLSDNDPRLIEIMQGIYDENFERFKRPFKGAEISLLEPEYIKDWTALLGKYIDEPTRSLQEKIEAKRLLDFFTEKGKGITNIVNKTGRQRREPLRFDDLFKDKSHAQEIRDIFTANGYTKNGKWVDLSNDRRTILLNAYYELRPLLKTDKKVTPAAKAFYFEFGLPEDYLNPRTYTKEPTRNSPTRKEFSRLFAKLLDNR